MVKEIDGVWYIVDEYGNPIKLCIDNIPRFRRRNGGTKSSIYFSIDKNWLSTYFNVSRTTISNWIKKKLFNPLDIESIVDYKRNIMRSN